MEKLVLVFAVALALAVGVPGGYVGATGLAERPQESRPVDAGHRDPPPPPRVLDARVVGLVPGYMHDSDGAYWQTVALGMREAADDLFRRGSGRGYVFLVPDALHENSAEQQINLVDMMVRRGVDALVVAPLDTAVLLPSLERARRAGISVVTAGGGVEPLATFSHVAMDTREAGRRAVEALQRVRSTAPVALVARESRDPVVAARVAAVHAALGPSGETAVRTDLTAESAAVTLGDLLNRGGAVRGVVVLDAASVSDVVRAAREQDRTGDLAVVAFDAWPDAVAALEDGAITALFSATPGALGGAVLRTVDRLLDGGVGASRTVELLPPVYLDGATVHLPENRAVVREFYLHRDSRE